jgi:preprotein translocase subunit SecG
LLVCGQNSFNAVRVYGQFKSYPILSLLRCPPGERADNRVVRNPSFCIAEADFGVLMVRFRMSILLNLVLALMVLLSLFLGLVILLQRPRADSGMGAAIGGGGVMESTFGAESANVLTKATVWCTAIFFVVGFLLYLGFIGVHRAELKRSGTLPTIEVPAAAAAGVPSAPTGQLEQGAAAAETAAPAAAATTETPAPAPAATEATPAPAPSTEPAPATPPTP